MKKHYKKHYKLALMAAIGLVSVTVAQAQYSGDLVVGVYQSGVANTEVYDLGTFGGLYSGETWNLSSALNTAGFSATLNSSADFGVVGFDTVSPGSLDESVMYVTTAGSTPLTLTGSSKYNVPRADIATIGSNEGAQTINAENDVDWYSQTLSGGPGLTSDLGYNLGSAVTGTLDLWSVQDNGSAPTLDGFFGLNASNEILTFVAVPEPTTYSIMAGAGLLMLSLHNKFRRKQS
jgi:hypothetical protein